MPRKIRLGTVVAIPLTNGHHAYGRVHEDANLAIYSLVSPALVTLEQVSSSPVAFFTGAFDTAIRSGEWPILGVLPFPDNESAWAPPTYIQDIIDPTKYRIYHRGEMRPATPDETAGLDIACVRKPGQVVDLIEQRLLPRA